MARTIRAHAIAYGNDMISAERLMDIAIWPFIAISDISNEVNRKGGAPRTQVGFVGFGFRLCGHRVDSARVFRRSQIMSTKWCAAHPVRV